MSNPKPNLKAILKDICTTERCLGVLRQTSAYFNERGNSLLTESLRDNPGPAIELLGYFPSPKSFLGSTLAGTVGAFTNTISELDGRANTCRGVVQAELEVLLEQADGEGLQEDRDTANECLATCDKVNTAARDEYRQQLPLCIESLSMTLMLVPEPPMALRMLLEKLAGFAGILLEFELASVDNPTRTEIPLLACLRECQKLQKQTAGDLRAVASERITAATLMLERYRNTIRIVLATIDSDKWPIPKRTMCETIIDHKEEYTLFKEQNAAYREEAVDIAKQHPALCVSVSPTDLEFLPAVPFTELLSKLKATVNGHGKSISKVYENLENIQESEQGMECTQRCITICEEALMECTQRCITICEEALRKAVNDDAEDFEFVSAED